MFAEIVPNTKTPFDKPSFTYQIPEKMASDIKIGQLVLVSLGNRKVPGFVLEIKKQPPSLNIKLKNIEKIIYPQPLLNNQQILLAKWLAEYYLCSLSQAIFSMIPPYLAKGTKLKETSPPQEAEPLKIDSSLPVTSMHLSVSKNICSSPKNLFLLHEYSKKNRLIIYLQLIKEFVQKGQQIIVLFPEINSLIQLLPYLKKYQAAVLHSKLTPKQFAQQWLLIKTNQINVVLGSLSAIFAPLNNLGAIIIDEENSSLYKNEQSPRYHVKKVAEKISELTNCKIILGATTPSIESYYQYFLGKYEIQKTHSIFYLPQIKVVDLNHEYRSGVKNIISYSLQQDLREIIENKKQAILFINRKGLSNLTLCRDCGYIFRCPSCQKPYQLLPNQNLYCSLCKNEIAIPLCCPHCQGTKIYHFGGGTQKIETEVKKLFPQIKIGRIDKEVKSKKQEIIIKEFQNKKIDILIGTQAILNYNLDKIDLVSIILPELSLNLPDFNAGEKTFNLLIKLILLAKQKVDILTSVPENQIIKSAQKLNYEKFYRQEIKTRRDLNYPPFCQLIKLTYSNKNQKKAEKEAQRLLSVISNLVLAQKHLLGRDDKLSTIQVFGPFQIFKKGGHFTYQIVLKKPVNINLWTNDQNLWNMLKDWSIDIDPISLL